MKHNLFTFTLCLSLLALTAEPPRFPAAADMDNPALWTKNSSGTMNISWDDAEKAVRFDIEFPPAVDQWVYPQFRFKPPVTLNGATALNFDMKVVPVEGFAGYKCCLTMLEGRDGYEPAEPGIWKSFHINLKDNDVNNANSFSIGMNPNHKKHSYMIRNISFEGTPKAHELPPAIRTDAPATVFFENTEHTFSCTRTLANLKYTVVNWLGKDIISGVWPDNGASPLVLKPLPPGYYIIKTTNDTDIKLHDYSFTVIINPDKRIYPKDSFFAMDAALSWVSSPGHFECPWYDGDTYRLTCDLCKWAGLVHLRERLSWSNTQKLPDAAPEYGHYLNNAHLCKDRNIIISGMFHDSPTWAGRLTKLPGNLIHLYNYCRETGKTFGDCMGNWEFWNEQDIGFAPEPAWDYAAALKAAYLGFKAGKADMPVTIGAICAGTDNPYVDTMFANDAAKFSDFMNVHTYTHLANYSGFHDTNRAMLKRIGREDWELWITECGTNLEGNSTMDGVVKGVKAHSPEQELILAEFYPKSQIYHMMNGVKRNYYFVFGAYNERNNTKDWGIIRRDGTLKPSYATMATIVQHLTAAKLQGELKINEQLKAFVFDQPDGTQTLAFWSVSDCDTATGGTVKITSNNPITFDLPLANGTYAMTDMVGTPGSVKVTDGTAHLTALRYPAYISGLKGLVATAKPRYPIGRQMVYQPTADEDLSVIIRADLNPEDFNITDRKSIAEMPKSSGKLKLQVWNLETFAKTGSLQVSGGTMQGLPAVLTVPPMDKVEIEATFTPTLGNGTTDVQLVMSGIFNGRKSSKTVIPIRPSGLLLQACTRLPLAADKPEAWRKNSSADSCTISYDKDEKAVRFDVVWTNPDKDRWFYPEYILNLPKESLAKAYAIEFEVKTTQDKVENDFKNAVFMLCYGTINQGGKYQNIGYSHPMQGWEPRRIVFGRNLNLKDVEMIRIGANPVGQKLTYWIRNIRLLNLP